MTRPAPVAIDATLLRRAVRPLDDPPSAPGWNAAESSELFDPALPRRSAAVLVPLVWRDPDFSVLFTVRTAQLRQHAGQVSFPGGSVESCDANAVATALRETREETGIAPSSIEAFGYLDSFETVSGYCVAPVTGFVEGGYRAAPDGIEVAQLFEVPLGFILAPGRFVSKRIEWRGCVREVFEFEWQGHRVWGATAAMLLNLVRRLEAVT